MEKSIKLEKALLDQRLKLEVEEVLGEVNDFLWIYYGRPQYILKKFKICPWTLANDDLDKIKDLLDKAPSIDQLMKCHRLVGALSITCEQKDSLINLQRAIDNIQKVRTNLSGLIQRIQTHLANVEIKREANIKPAPIDKLTNIKSCELDLLCEKMSDKRKIDVHFDKSSALTQPFAKIKKDNSKTIEKEPNITMKMPKKM